MARPQKAEEILVSGDELFRRPDLGPCELVSGRVVPMAPTGYKHGKIEIRLGARLLIWAESTGLGQIFSGEVGIFVRRSPDTVRAADLIFISSERYARRQSSGYLDIPPELVIEILSPDDRWTDVMAKLGDYFAADVDRVWVVDSKLRKVFSYRSLTLVSSLNEDDDLSDEELLPGFSMSLADLFRE